MFISFGFSDFGFTLIALGVAVGLIFDDYFGVIAGIGSMMQQFGNAGIAGLIALLLIVSFYNKQK